MQPYTVGYYCPTEDFKRIQEHAAVMQVDNCGLVAVTGPADDPESVELAHLFAAAPALLDACRKAVHNMEFYGAGSFGVCEEIRAVIAQATGAKQTNEL